MTVHHDAIRLFVAIPEELVDRPLIYEMIKHFDVVPSIPARERRDAHRVGDPRALRSARRA